MIRFVYLSLFSLCLLSESAASNIGVRLGSIQVAERSDKDVIVLPPCNGKDNIKVNSIQLQIQKKPVQVDKLKVVFHNGQQQTLSVKKHFKAGDSSRWIDLKGDARCIKRIVFIGDTDTKGFKPKKQSTVVVFGQAKISPRNVNADDQLNKSNQNNTTRLGAIRLGEQTEKKGLSLPPCNGKNNSAVSKVKLRVQDHPAEINRIKIVFYNGKEQSFPVNKNFKVGEVTPWIDLKGEQRCIKRIVFVGDANTPGFTPGKQAKVIIIGKK